MYDYVANELVEIVNTHLLVDAERKSINGHSMGGDGALLGTRRSDRYASLPAFAPVCAASQSEWSRRTLKEYLSPDEEVWRECGHSNFFASSFIAGHRRVPAEALH